MLIIKYIELLFLLQMQIKLNLSKYMIQLINQEKEVQKYHHSEKMY